MPAKRTRNYRREYVTHQAKPEQKKRRAARNAARKMMMKAWRVKKGDGKEVDHKDMNPRNNSRKNLRVVSRTANRKRQPKRS